MRRYVTTRRVGLHALLVVLLVAFSWLTKWQLARAEGGNTLSWAYVFLWPLFGIYAIYLWWQLIHDEPAIPGRRSERQRESLEDGDAGDGDAGDGDAGDGDAAARPPGWALTGGRRRSRAIAAASPIDPVRGGRGERFRAQTADEAARLAQYNRYLADLAADDAAQEAR